MIRVAVMKKTAGRLLMRKLSHFDPVIVEKAMLGLAADADD